jgi:hypothetical protein
MAQLFGSELLPLISFVEESLTDFLQDLFDGSGAVHVRKPSRRM